MILYNNLKSQVFGTAFIALLIILAGGVTMASASPALKIVKLVNGIDTVNSSDAVHVKINDTVTFTLIITNNGTVNLTNLSVTDALPLKLFNKGLSYAFGTDTPPNDGLASSIGPTGWIDFTVQWLGHSNFTPGHLASLEPLKPGDSFEISFNATVDPEAGGLYMNTAYVSAKTESVVENIHVDQQIDVSAIDEGFVFVEKKTPVPLLNPSGIMVLLGAMVIISIYFIRKRR
jgi:uncharacterized repeat protein (TIGR01451 family)